MNRELERLILALDEALESFPADTAKARFDALLAETLEAHSGLSEESLSKAVTLAHSRWLRAQRKPTDSFPRA